MPAGFLTAHFGAPRAPRKAGSEPQAPLPAPSSCGAHRGQQQQFPAPEGHSGRPGGKGGGSKGAAPGGQGCTASVENRGGKLR